MTEKLGSLTQKFAHSSFGSLVHSLHSKDNLSKNIFDFTTAGDWDCVAAVERPPVLHYRVDLFSCPLGSWDLLLNFETIRGSLMRPKRPKLASLAQKFAHFSFSSLVHSFLPKDNLFKNIFYCIPHFASFFITKAKILDTCKPLHQE